MTIVFQRAASSVGTGSMSVDIGSAGNNRLIVIQIGDESTGTDDVALGTVTVDSKSATLRLAKTNPDGAGNLQEFWTIDEAALGASAGTVTIAFTGLDSGVGKRVLVHYGVDSGVPTDTDFNDTAIAPTTPDISLDVVANGLVVYGGGNGSSGGSSGWTSPLTERIDGGTNPPVSAVLGIAEGIETSAQTAKTYSVTLGSTLRSTGLGMAFAPSVDALTPAAETLAFSGKVPSVKHDVFLGVAYLALRLITLKGLRFDGYAPTIISGASHIVEPGAETLSLSGKTPTALRADFVTPAIDDLVLAGKAPSVERDYFIDVAEGSLALAGKAPSVERDYFIDITQGIFVLDGKTPSVLSADALTPNTELLVLAGQAPSVERNYFIDVAEVALTFVGHAPGLSGDEVTTPAAATLALAGQAPSLDFGMLTASDRENFFADSEDASAWTRLTNGTIDVNVALAPNGTMTADRFTDDATDAAHFTGQQNYLGIRYLEPRNNSIFVSTEGESARYLAFNTRTPNVVSGWNSVFDTQTGTFTQQSGNYDDFIITDEGNGWWRLSSTDANLLPQYDNLYVAICQGPTRADMEYIGTGDTFLVWGGQTTFSSRSKYIPNPTSGTTTASLLGLNGQVPIVAIGVAPAAETLVLTGKVPTTLSAAISAPNTELLVLAGQAPTVERDYFIDVAAASLVVSGKAPSGEQDIVVVVPYVELNLITLRGLNLHGYAPTVVETASDTLTPAADTLVLAGQVPSLISSVTISIPYVELNLVVVRGLQLQGHPPIVGSSVTSSPGVVALTLSGKQPSVERDFFIDVAAATLVLDGKALSTAEDTTKVPNTTLLTLSGKAPSVERDFFIDVAAATLVLNGKVPEVGLSESADPGVGPLTLVGQVPATFFEDNVNPGAASLIVAGQDVVADQPNVVLTISAGTLNFSSQSPVANVSHRIDVAAAELTLTGHIPGDVDVLISSATALTLVTGTPKIRIERHKRVRRRLISLSKRYRIRVLYK